MILFSLSLHQQWNKKFLVTHFLFSSFNFFPAPFYYLLTYSMKQDMPRNTCSFSLFSFFLFSHSIPFTHSWNETWPRNTCSFDAFWCLHSTTTFIHCLYFIYLVSLCSFHYFLLSLFLLFLLTLIFFQWQLHLELPNVSPW